jgi:NAD(P)-dependent dehydrogenase (short-subunit alcohol dehydrogenase family)
MNILITGGSRGIGSAISKKFIDNSHTVYCPTRQELDLSKDFMLNLTNFDIIINNAGINPLNSMIDSIDYNTFNVNFFSPLKIIQQCLPYMVKNRYGRIVNIGSVFINFSKKFRYNYSASKSALHSITKSIVAEFGEYNILANTVSPGFIDTDLTRQNNTEEQIQKILKEKVPVKRLGTIQEIADLVYFLSVENSFIAGQNIIIDGGLSACLI